MLALDNLFNLSFFIENGFLNQLIKNVGKVRGVLVFQRIDNIRYCQLQGLAIDVGDNGCNNGVLFGRGVDHQRVGRFDDDDLHFLGGQRPLCSCKNRAWRWGRCRLARRNGGPGGNPAPRGGHPFGTDYAQLFQFLSHLFGADVLNLIDPD